MASLKSKFAEHGESEKSLGWSKNKQAIRFHALTRNFNLANKSILDVGCGFGDMYTFLKMRTTVDSYRGVDLMPQFIEVATKNITDSSKQSFHCSNFLTDKTEASDFVVGSGVFGFALHTTEEENYSHVENFFKKAHETCRSGFAFDFISDNKNGRGGGQT